MAAVVPILPASTGRQPMSETKLPTASEIEKTSAQCETKKMETEAAPSSPHENSLSRLLPQPSFVINELKKPRKGTWGFPLNKFEDFLGAYPEFNRLGHDLQNQMLTDFGVSADERLQILLAYQRIRRIMAIQKTDVERSTESNNSRYGTRFLKWAIYKSGFDTERRLENFTEQRKRRHKILREVGQRKWLGIKCPAAQKLGPEAERGMEAAIAKHGEDVSRLQDKLQQTATKLSNMLTGRVQALSMQMDALANQCASDDLNLEDKKNLQSAAFKLEARGMQDNDRDDDRALRQTSLARRKSTFGGVVNKKIVLKHYTPPIDVSVKIQRVADVDMVKNRFDCTFIVMLDWEDPSLQYLWSTSLGGVRVSSSLSSRQYIYQKHFDPKYVIENAVEADTEFVGQASVPRLSKMYECHVKWTQQFQATLYVNLNPMYYPYDFQQLRINVKVSSMYTSDLQPSVFRVDGRIFPELMHPVRFRQKQGQQLDSNADHLSNFELVGINGYRSPWHYDTYTVLIGIKREPFDILVSILLTQVVVAVLSSFAFFMTQFEEALGVVLTGLLTAVAFKIIIADSLPPQPTLSTIEIFMLCAYIQFFYQGVCLCTVHLLEYNALQDVEGYECKPEVHLFNRTADDLGFEDLRIDSITSMSCGAIALINLVLFFGHNLMTLSFAVYILCWAQQRQSRSERFMRDTWQVFYHEEPEWGIMSRVARGITRATMCWEQYKEAWPADKPKHGKDIEFCKTPLAPPQYFKLWKCLTCGKGGTPINMQLPQMYRSPKMSCLFEARTGEKKNGSQTITLSLASRKLWWQHQKSKSDKNDAKKKEKLRCPKTELLHKLALVLAAANDELQNRTPQTTQQRYNLTKYRDSIERVYDAAITTYSADLEKACKGVASDKDRQFLLKFAMDDIKEMKVKEHLIAAGVPGAADFDIAEIKLILKEIFYTDVIRHEEKGRAKFSSNKLKLNKVILKAFAPRIILGTNENKMHKTHMKFAALTSRSKLYERAQELKDHLKDAGL